MSRTATFAACCALALSSTTSAEEVTLEHNGLTLNANLQLVEEQPLSGRVAMITHGTLAHNGMEIIATLQELLADEEIPSLAINLSLGLDNRHGMYDCAVPHDHKHTDAVDEINRWHQWLKDQGAAEVITIGHSRGGNQVAWYNQDHSGQSLAQVLIAPATWSEAGAAENYQNRYQQPLQPLLEQAQSLSPDKALKNTGFIYCQDSTVNAGSFANYYTPDQRFNTPTLLQQTSLPTLVLIGSEDNTVANLPEAMAEVSTAAVQSVTIDGADHYFRDLYADEMIEHIVEFMDQL